MLHCDKCRKFDKLDHKLQNLMKMYTTCSISECYRQAQYDKTTVIPALLYASEITKMAEGKEKLEAEIKETQVIYSGTLLLEQNSVFL